MLDQAVSWGEFIILVLFVLGTILLVYLTFLVINLLKTVKDVNQILSKNKDNINKTLDKLPEIADNAAKITKTLNENMDGIQNVVNDIGKISGTIKNGVETIQKDIIIKAKSILEIADLIRNWFEKRKEKKKKKNTVYKYTYKPGQDMPEVVEMVSTDDTGNLEEKGYVKEEDPALNPEESDSSKASGIDEETSEEDNEVSEDLSYKETPPEDNS
jgi:hypothetical protein